MQWRSWLGHCASNREVADSISDGVMGIFHWHYISGCTMTLGSSQTLTEMSTKNISWGIKAAGAYSWQSYHLHVPIISKSGSLKFLEISGSVIGIYRGCFTFFCTQFETIRYFVQNSHHLLHPKPTNSTRKLCTLDYYINFNTTFPLTSMSPQLFFSRLLPHLSMIHSPPTSTYLFFHSPVTPYWEM